MTEPIGEVIGASTAEFTAQVARPGQAPPFGSFVRVRGDRCDIFAVVASVRVGPLDPGARPVLRGRDGVRDAAIYAEHPDLLRVLRTEFLALVVACGVDGRIRMHLPPLPPPLHYSVYLCSPDEARQLSDDFTYLRTILAATGAPADEVIAANLRWAAASRPHDADFLLRAGRHLATLLRGDYDRLATLLRRLDTEG